MRATLAVAAIASLSLAGCANSDNFGTGALVGGAVGALGGAAVGSALSRPVVYEAPPQVVYRPAYYEPRPWGYARGGYGYRDGWHRRGW